MSVKPTAPRQIPVPMPAPAAAPLRVVPPAVAEVATPSPGINVVDRPPQSTLGALSSPKKFDEPIRGYFNWDTIGARKVVLTIDDGPIAGKTDKLLDVLQQEKVKATFFVVGTNITAHTYMLLRRMVAEGHIIGNHTQSHDTKLVSRTKEDMTRELLLTQAMVDLALTVESPEELTAMSALVHKAMDHGDPVAALDKLRRDAVLPELSPYPLEHMRPPGGGPFYSRDSEAQKRSGSSPQQKFSGVVRAVDQTVIMWNVASIDADGTRPASERRDPGRVAASVTGSFRKGASWINAAV